MSLLAAYIMRGRMQAMLVASTLAMLSLLLPPVSIVSSAAVALVTLRLGAYEGLIVLLSSCIVAAVAGFLLLGAYHFSLLYGLVLWLPIWLIAVALREGRHLSLAVEIAVLLGAVAVIGFYLYNGTPEVMWQGMLEQMMQPMLQNSPDDVPVEKIQQTFAMMAHFMTGIVAAGTIFSMLFGLFLARWWQSVLFNPGGFRQEYLSLTTHQSMAMLSLLLIGLSMTPLGIITEIARNICVLLFVLYSFVGSAVLHVSFANMAAKRFLVPMLYITLGMIPHTLVIVAVIGLLDAKLDLRNKHSK